MDKLSTFRLSLIAAAIASFGGFAGAQEVVNPAASGFVADGTGDVVRSAASGECVQSGMGASIEGVPECGGLVVTQEIIPPPSPQAQAPAEPPPPPQAQALDEPPPAQALAEPEPAPVSPPPMQRITLDADTTFNFDSAELTDEGKEQLQNIVEAGEGEDVDRLRIHITGYADRIGPEEYNLSLSKERANTVRSYLVEQGLPADMITMEARGETNPVVQCEGMTGVTLVECLRPNRRSEVEFAALEKAEQAEPSKAAPEETAPSAQPPGSPPSESGAQQQPWSPGTDTGTPR